jgi:hypothetical protein
MSTMPRPDAEPIASTEADTPGAATSVRGARAPLAATAAGVAFAALMAGCGSSIGEQNLPPIVVDQPTQTSIPADQRSQPPATTMPGLPSDWQSRAVGAANAALKACAAATSLNPTGCPQQISDAGAVVQTVQWSLLSDGLAHATAVPVPQPDQGPTSGGNGQIVVYGRYAMDVSYVVAGQGLRPSLDYSGGLAQATLSWDGTSFQNVQFTSGEVTLPANVTVQPFARPAGATDAAALAAVNAGFNDCVTIAVPATDPVVANCPQGGTRTDMHATGGHWLLQGDPLQGALVSFTPEHGDVTVTGNFDMNFDYTTPPEGPDHGTSWTARCFGHYTAILSWDGSTLELLNMVRR